MRRSSIACRGAVHAVASSPAPFVWVPDDLLERAFRQFFRLERVHHHQVRHGSHVPGPLEARRRSAKRRMTLQSHQVVDQGLSSLFSDFEALFRRRPQWETAWRYEPPSLPRSEEQLLMQSDPAPSIETPPPSPPPTIEPPKAGSKGCDLPFFDSTIAPKASKAPASRSSPSATKLKDNIAHDPSGVLVDRHSNELRYTIPSDEQSIRKLFKREWASLESRRHTLDHPQQTISRLRELAHNLTWLDFDADVEPMLGDYQQFNDHLTMLMQRELANPQKTIRIFELIPRPTVLKWIRSVPHRAGSISSAEDLESHQDVMAQIQSWLRFLRLVDGKAADARQSLVSVAYTALGRAGFTPAILKDQEMTASQLTYVVRFWILNHPSMSKIPGKDLRSIQSSLILPPTMTSEQKFLDSLSHLVFRTAQSSNSTHEVANWLLDLLQACRGPEAAELFIRKLSSRNVKFFDSSFLHSYLSDMLERSTSTMLQPTHHTRTAVCTWALGLLQVIRSLEHAPEAARRDMLQTSHAVEANLQFQRIIASARAVGVLPTEYHDEDCEKFTESGLDLIYQLAYTYAHNTTRSHLSNARSLDVLYKFVRKHRLPLNPTFCQALVQGYLIRPMSEGTFVRSEKVVQVCRLVNEVEGEVVARNIERIFWEWRGDQIKQAHARLMELGGNGRVYVNSMKKYKLL